MNLFVSAPGMAFVLILTLLQTGHCDYARGVEALQRGNYESAREEFLRAAESGDAYAAYMLGELYDKGVGVEMSDRNAFAWFRRSAELGLPKGMFMAGLDAEIGITGKPDPLLAVYWYRKAAELGDAGSLKHLDEMVKKNPNIHIPIGYMTGATPRPGSAAPPVVSGQLNGPETKTDDQRPQGSAPPEHSAAAPAEMDAGDWAALGALLVGAYWLSSNSDTSDQTGNAISQGCRQEAEARIVWCASGLPHCDSLGCSYDVSCNYGAGQCRRYTSTSSPYGFYCDSKDADNTSSDKETLIATICSEEQK